MHLSSFGCIAFEYIVLLQLLQRIVLMAYNSGLYFESQPWACQTLFMEASNDSTHYNNSAENVLILAAFYFG